jgi:hypothetical protein
MALAEELGWSIEGFREAFAELLAKGLVKADFSARVLYQTVVKFRESPAGKKGEYTPHPATWFNADKFFDDPQANNISFGSSIYPLTEVCAYEAICQGNNPPFP